MSTTTTFGPGTFTLGDTGSEFDASCLVNSLTITVSKDTGDSTTKLCGTKKPGAVTYTYTLDGNVDLDQDDPGGFFATCNELAGTEQPFTFVPNTAGETEASGTVIVDPLNFGGDTYGEDMTSDFSFDLVGPPVYKFPTPPDPGVQQSNRFAPIAVNVPTVVRKTAAKSSSSSKTPEPAAV